MTPIEARLHTLNEIVEFAKKEQKQYEGVPFMEDMEERQYFHPQYFALQIVIDECNRLKLLKDDNKRS